MQQASTWTHHFPFKACIRVSPCIVAPPRHDLSGFFRLKTIDRKLPKAAVRLPVSLLRHTHAHSANTDSNKGFQSPQLHSPLFFCVSGEREGHGCHGDASPAEANLCGPLVGPDGVCVCVCEGERVREREQAVYFQTWWWLLCPLSTEMLPQTGSLVRPKGTAVFQLW